MKPKILCGACGSPLLIEEKLCGNCGSPVEWSGVDTEKAVATNAPNAGSKAREAAENKGKQQKAVAPSWKVVAGFAIFLAVGVLSLELLTAKKIEHVPHIHEDEPAGANMQALQQVQELEAKLTTNPEDQKLLLQLANLLHDARFFDKAIQRYTEYLQRNPNDHDARVDLGICYYETDRTDEAKREMLKALEKNPKHVLGSFNLGIVHLRIAQRAMASGMTEAAHAAVDEANSWFQKTVVLDPGGEVGQRARRLLAQHAQQKSQ